MQDRPRIWLLGVLLALPLAGIGLLLAVPSIDVEWEHHPSHFLLVLAVALINFGLALVASEAAHRRTGARPAALGHVGAGAHRSFTSIGDTRNVAARLRAAARLGGTLIGRAAYEAVRNGSRSSPSASST